MSNQEIVIAEKQSLPGNNGFMNVTSLEAAIKCSELIASSNFCPKGMAGRPGDVLVALQMGLELGLKPMQAIQNIAVINGRPSLWGDAMLAVCRQAPGFEMFTEEYNELTKTWTCTAKRKNEPPVVRTFSAEDAKTAGLLNKDGPWKTYPKRMIQMRARGFALRDTFSDVLRGIIIREEAQDMPEEKRDYSEYKTLQAVEAEIVIDDIQLIGLRQKIKDAGAEEDKICSLLKIEGLQKISVAQARDISAMLDKKIKKKQETEQLKINEFFNEEPQAQAMEAEA